jgi:putative membrane protein
MRILLILLALSLLASGFAFGALNPVAVGVDLFGLELRLRLGSALLLAAFCGALAAGSVLTALVILPLKRRLRRAEGEARAVAEPGERTAGA